MDNKYKDRFIDEKFNGVNAKIDSNHELINIKLDQILKQTIKTNGRVTKLEEETRFVRFFTKYPKAAGIAFIGIISCVFIFGLKAIFKIF